MMMRWFVGLSCLVLAGSALAQTTKGPAPANPPIWNRLERFSSEAEFMRYVREVQRINAPPRRVRWNVRYRSRPGSRMSMNWRRRMRC